MMVYHIDTNKSNKVIGDGNIENMSIWNASP